MSKRTVTNTAASVRQRLLNLAKAPPAFSEVWQAVMTFLQPVAEVIQLDRSFEMAWLPGGPWLPMK